MGLPAPDVAHSPPRLVYGLADGADGARECPVERRQVQVAVWTGVGPYARKSSNPLQEENTASTPRTATKRSAAELFVALLFRRCSVLISSEASLTCGDKG